MHTRRSAFGTCLLAVTLCLAPDAARAVEFERIVIDADFPGAYQVEVADVNGDKKPDVIAVGGGTCAWYENPSWKKRIITGPKVTPGIISSATADLDGDGRAEVAIAYEFSMNEPTKGKLLVASPGKAVDDPWTTTHVADIGSIHRLRWSVGMYRVQFPPDAAGRPAKKTEIQFRQLIVAPIFGSSAKPPLFQQEPAHIVWFFAPLANPSPFIPRAEPELKQPGLKGFSFPIPDRPLLEFQGSDPKTGHPIPGVIGDAPVVHAIDVVNMLKTDDSDNPVIFSASNLGVSMHIVAIVAGSPHYESRPLVAGAPGDAPKKGASEVHLGKLKTQGSFLATVEPWHGTDIAIYLSKPGPGLQFGPRHVIDTSLKEGHALWVADVDGDGDDEVFAGYRGKGTSVLMYDFNGKTWDRTVVDSAIAAQDLRGGDLDGDGTPDIVAVGGSTHNVVWYRPIRKPK